MKRDLELVCFKNLLNRVNTSFRTIDEFVYFSSFDQNLNLNLENFGETFDFKNYEECSTSLKNPIDLLSNRLVGIKKVEINSRLDDYLSLIKFFEKLGYLEELIIENFSMDNNFYDLLPKYVSIRKLTISRSLSLNRNINTNFLTEFDVYELFIDGPEIPIVTHKEDLKRFYSTLKVLLLNLRFKTLSATMKWR